MIHQTLSLIVQQLDAYIENQVQSGDPPNVVVGNISLSSTLGGNERFMSDKIVLSLVNLMEEVSMKNAPPFRPSFPNTEMEFPPVFLNLYLLFTANYPYDGNDDSIGIVQYNRGLSNLSHVVEFFQGKRQFTIQNTPDAGLLADPAMQDLCLNMELVSLTFEQINYLWGSLGGKQLPFVLYKAHVVPIKRELVSGRGGRIQEIQSQTLHHKPAKS